MQVKLTYFKPNGKYYSEGEFDYPNPDDPLFNIWAHVMVLRDTRRLPDLVEGHSDLYIISVEVPEHRHNHPHLIVPNVMVRAGGYGA